MVDVVKNYVQGKLELLKLDAIEKTSITVGGIVLGVLLALFILICIILGNIGFAVMLGYYLENLAYGFLAVAGFYLLLVIICIIFKRYVIEGVANIVIKLINKKNP